jgi:pyridoxamine 5'-phosphate oxidase
MPLHSARPLSMYNNNKCVTNCINNKYPSSRTGLPSTRMVLLKKYSPTGFTIYTCYDSRKAREMDENPHAAMMIYWPLLHRQVRGWIDGHNVVYLLIQIRIEGTMSRCDDLDSDEYWNKRPYESRLSAAASMQSRPVASR